MLVYGVNLVLFERSESRVLRWK